MSNKAATPLEHLISGMHAGVLKHRHDTAMLLSAVGAGAAMISSIGAGAGMTSSDAAPIIRMTAAMAGTATSVSGYYLCSIIMAQLVSGKPKRPINRASPHFRKGATVGMLAPLMMTPSLAHDTTQALIKYGQEIERHETFPLGHITHDFNKVSCDDYDYDAQENTLTARTTPKPPACKP